MSRNRKQIDRQLVRKIHRGDKAAFKRFYLHYFKTLFRFCKRYVKSGPVAESIVQEVFADIWDKGKSWNPQRSVRVYLFQTVKFRALDYIKHQEVNKRNEEQWTRNRKKSYIQFRNKDSATLIRRAVSEAVEHLPTRCRMAYTLHRKEGLTYEEIAEVMEVSVKTVESHMTRALKRLRRELKSYDFDFLWIYKD